LSKNAADAHAVRGHTLGKTLNGASILYGGAARLRREKRNISRPNPAGRRPAAKKFFTTGAFPRQGVAQKDGGGATRAPALTAPRRREERGATNGTNEHEFRTTSFSFVPLCPICRRRGRAANAGMAEARRAAEHPTISSRGLLRAIVILVWRKQFLQVGRR
jgi:hypothetical protein